MVCLSVDSGMGSRDMATACCWDGWTDWVKTGAMSTVAAGRGGVTTCTAPWSVVGLTVDGEGTTTPVGL